MESIEGLTWIGTLNISYDPVITFITDTVKTILGYEPEEMIGTTILSYIHPDENENARALVIHGLHEDSVAGVTYLRMRTKNGDYKLIASSYNTVYDRVVCTGAIAVPGQKARLRAATAKETIPLTPAPTSRYQFSNWQSPRDNPPLQSERSLIDNPPPLPSLSKRTCLFLNRFTLECTIMWVTNDLFVNPKVALNRSFYDFVAEQDLEEVKGLIEAAKAWGRHGDSKSEGGFEYGTFRLCPLGKSAAKKRRRSPSPPDTAQAESSGSVTQNVAQTAIPHTDYRIVDAVYTAASDGLLVFLRDAVGITS